MERIEPKKTSGQPTRRTKLLRQGRVRRRLPPVHTLTRRTHPSTPGGKRSAGPAEVTPDV